VADREIILETPRGAVITRSFSGGDMSAEVIFFPGALEKLKDQFHSAQAWLDNAILEDTAPYVPMITGALVQSGILGTVIGTGMIYYIAPYAKKVWERDTPPSKEAHPAASRRWIEPSKAANMDRWMAGVVSFVKGGN
jgi:hypothetical protein